MSTADPPSVPPIRREIASIQQGIKRQQTPYPVTPPDAISSDSGETTTRVHLAPNLQTPGSKVNASLSAEENTNTPRSADRSRSQNNVNFDENVTAIDAPPRQQWVTDICDPGMGNACPCESFIPCFPFGRTRHRLRQLDHHQDPLDLTEFKACNSACCEWVALAAFLPFCGPAIYTAKETRRVREVYGIDGDYQDDVFKALFCPCCSVIRNELEIRHREEARELQEIHPLGPVADQPPLTSAMRHVAPVPANSKLPRDKIHKASSDGPCARTFSPDIDPADIQRLRDAVAELPGTGVVKERKPMDKGKSPIIPRGQENIGSSPQRVAELFVPLQGSTLQVPGRDAFLTPISERRSEDQMSIAKITSPRQAADSTVLQAIEASPRASQDVSRLPTPVPSILSPSQQAGSQHGGPSQTDLIGALPPPLEGQEIQAGPTQELSIAAANALSDHDHGGAVRKKRAGPHDLASDILEPIYHSVAKSPFHHLGQDRTVTEQTGPLKAHDLSADRQETNPVAAARPLHRLSQDPTAREQVQPSKVHRLSADTQAPSLDPKAKSQEPIKKFPLHGLGQDPVVTELSGQSKPHDLSADPEAPSDDIKPQIGRKLPDDGKKPSPAHHLEHDPKVAEPIGQARVHDLSSDHQEPAEQIRPPKVHDLSADRQKPVRDDRAHPREQVLGKARKPSFEARRQLSGQESTGSQRTPSHMNEPLDDSGTETPDVTGQTPHLRVDDWLGDVPKPVSRMHDLRDDARVQTPITHKVAYHDLETDETILQRVDVKPHALESDEQLATLLVIEPRSHDISRDERVPTPLGHLPETHDIHADDRVSSPAILHPQVHSIGKDEKAPTTEHMPHRTHSLEADKKIDEPVEQSNERLLDEDQQSPDQIRVHPPPHVLEKDVQENVANGGEHQSRTPPGAFPASPPPKQQAAVPPPTVTRPARPDSKQPGKMGGGKPDKADARAKAPTKVDQRDQGKPDNGKIPAKKDETDASAVEIRSTSPTPSRKGNGIPDREPTPRIMRISTNPVPPVLTNRARSPSPAPISRAAPLPGRENAPSPPPVSAATLSTPPGATNTNQLADTGIPSVPVNDKKQSSEPQRAARDAATALGGIPATMSASLPGAGEPPSPPAESKSQPQGPVSQPASRIPRLVQGASSGGGAKTPESKGGFFGGFWNRGKAASLAESASRATPDAAAGTNVPTKGQDRARAGARREKTEMGQMDGARITRRPGRVSASGSSASGSWSASASVSGSGSPFASESGLGPIVCVPRPSASLPSGSLGRYTGRREQKGSVGVMVNKIEGQVRRHSELSR